MALDLHLALNKKSAIRNKPVLQIEWIPHRDLFFDKNKQKTMPHLKLLDRTSDHNSDAFFETTELPDLIQELKSIALPALPHPQRELVLGIISACEEGIKTKQNMYFFCD